MSDHVHHDYISLLKRLHSHRGSRSFIIKLSIDAQTTYLELLTVVECVLIHLLQYCSSVQL